MFIWCVWASTNIAASPTLRTVYGTVIKVSDGDTVQVMTHDQTKLKVRLYGIDAPEIAHGTPGQPYGEEAKQALASMVLGKDIRLDIIEVDHYRRMVGMIWIDKTNINLELVHQGYAEAYREHLAPEYRSEFLSAEDAAKTRHLGIWGLPDYERPSEFRHRTRNHWSRHIF